MKTIFLSLILFASVAHAQFSATFSDTSSGRTVWSAQAAKPTVDLPKTPYRWLSFITKSTKPLSGNITFQASLEIPDASFIVFRGENTWNTGCGRPAFWRFYASSNASYDNLRQAQHPEEFWFSEAYAILQPGESSLIVTIPSEALPAGAIAVGIAFGGGCYYDVGWAAQIPAIITLKHFQVVEYHKF